MSENVLFYSYTWSQLIIWSYFKDINLLPSKIVFDTLIFIPDPVIVISFPSFLLLSQQLLVCFLLTFKFQNPQMVYFGLFFFFKNIILLRYNFFFVITNYAKYPVSTFQSEISCFYFGGILFFKQFSSDFFLFLPTIGSQISGIDL